MPAFDGSKAASRESAKEFLFGLAKVLKVLHMERAAEAKVKEIVEFVAWWEKEIRRPGRNSK